MSKSRFRYDVVTMLLRIFGGIGSIRLESGKNSLRLENNIRTCCTKIKESITNQFCLQLATTLLEWIGGREENNRRNYFMINLRESMGPGRDLTHNPLICSQMRICNTPIPHRQRIARIATNWFFFIRGDLWGFIIFFSPIVIFYDSVPIQIRCRYEYLGELAQFGWNDKYLDSWLNRTQFVKILTDSHSP